MKNRLLNFLTAVILLLSSITTVNAQKNKVKTNVKTLINPSNLSLADRHITLHPTATIHTIDASLSIPTLQLSQKSVAEIFTNLSKENIMHISPLSPDSLVFFGSHPFLMGLTKAYQEHRPFIISPDIIWSLIEQGFARYITLNNHKFKNRLVNFQGKKELTIAINEDTNNPKKWNAIFPQFVNQIERFTGKDYVNNLRADFSTTTTDSKIISEITLMESVKTYFDYRVILMGCGISKITIEGDIQDWNNLLKKIDYIETFDLQWWTKELRPIINEIIHTKEGIKNTDFWNNMIQLGNEVPYRSHERIDGWITKFYPFLLSGKQRELNHIDNITNIAPEYVKVPFILDNKIENKEYPMEFWAGIFGMQQDYKTMALKPILTWAIIHQSAKGTNNPSQKDTYDMVSIQHIIEFPKEIFSLKKVEHLELGFTEQINIPDQIKNIDISILSLTGNIEENELKRIKSLLPNTKIIINNISLNQ